MTINGIGTDIVSKKRILNKKDIEKRFLTNLELKELSLYKNEIKRNDYISGRWAAKEAIIKSLDKKIGFLGISILNDSNGKPEIYLNNEKTNNIIVSISHEEEYAIAFSIVVEIFKV